MNRNLVSRAAGRSMMLALTAGAMALIHGCTMTVTTRRPPPPTVYGEAQGSAQAQGTVDVQPQVATGVTVVEVSCTPGAQEVCDGLDNNCNGAIDEGCGYSSGQIQITLAWNTGADIDLYVTDPYNETIYYGDRDSNSGGHLDVDARGACNQGQYQTVENVYWDSHQPPPGTYRVEVHYWAGNQCSYSAGPTPITLSISVGGQVIGAYNYVLNPHDRVAVATFQI